MHLFNYDELSRAHEKTTIFFFFTRRHLKCYAKCSVCTATVAQILAENSYALTSSPNSMLNTGFTSARTLAMLYHISPYLHQFGSRMQRGNAFGFFLFFFFISFLSAWCLRFSLHHKNHNNNKNGLLIKRNV